MKLRQEKCNLFSVPKEYYLAHCISADFGMGAGIAVQFNNHFDMKRKLITKYSDYLKVWDDKKNKGTCILEGKVFNLITKRNCWQKPTYKSLENALICMLNYAKYNNVKKIAMPMIGCGLDRLEESKVKDIINKIFEDTDIEILICVL